MTRPHPVPVETAAAPRRGRPFVSANFALSWDARASTGNRTPSDFSSPADKRHLTELRGLADAVVVGRRTLEADRMKMGISDPEVRRRRIAHGQSPEPLRVVVSGSGQLDPDLPLFHHRGAPVLLYTSERIPAAARKRLEGLAEVIVAGKDAVDPRAMLGDLRRRFGIRHLHCEGGPTLFRALAEAGLLDEIHLTLCPRIFGGETAPPITGIDPGFLPGSTRWRLAGCHPVGGECFLRYVAGRKRSGQDHPSNRRRSRATPSA